MTGSGFGPETSFALTAEIFRNKKRPMVNRAGLGCNK